MRAEIRHIHRTLGRTTIYVTHDQDEALSLADRIVVLRDGVVQQIGSPEEVYAQPSNLQVARFMGYRNIIELDVEGIDVGRVKLRAPGIAVTGTAQEPLPGRRAIAAMRPDEMAIGTQASPNAIAGTVAGVEYYGRDSLIDLVAGEGVRLYVRTAQRVEAGETVHVTVPVERVLVYPADPTLDGSANGH